MSEYYFITGKYCITHHNIINPALQGACGIYDGKECVSDAVSVKRKPNFTKEDVEKVAATIYGNDFYNTKIAVENNLLPNKQIQQRETFRHLEMVSTAKAALNAVGRVEE